MKIKITPRRGNQMTTQVSHYRQLDLKQTAVTLAGETFEVEASGNLTCRLPTGEEVMWHDVTEVIEPTPGNVEFCRQFVKRMTRARPTKTTTELRKIVEQGIELPIETMWDSFGLNDLFSNEPVMIWVYTFVRDNQRLFTR